MESLAWTHFLDAEKNETVLDFILRKRSIAPVQTHDEVVRNLLHIVGETENELVGRIQDAGLAESMLGYFALRGALAQGGSGSKD